MRVFFSTLMFEGFFNFVICNDLPVIIYALLKMIKTNQSFHLHIVINYIAFGQKRLFQVL